MDISEKLEYLKDAVKDVGSDLETISNEVNSLTQLKEFEYNKRRESERNIKQLEDTIDELLVLLTDILNHSQDASFSKDVWDYFENRKCVMEQRGEHLLYYQPGDNFFENDDVDWDEVNDNISSDYTIIGLNKIGIILDDLDNHKIIFKRKPKITVESKCTVSGLEEEECIGNEINALKSDNEEVCRLSLADGLSIKGPLTN